MDDLDELDIEIRDVDDIGCRIVLLTTLAIWPDHSTLDERDSWANWLEQQGVLPIATRAERRVLDEHREQELTEADLDICGRALDALQPLGWCVALTDERALTLDTETATALIEGIPIPNERIEPFLDGLVLRTEDEIAVERERSEVWNWRLAAEISLRRASGRNRIEVEEAIREVVLECAATLVIPDTDGSDFLIDGAPVRTLDDDALDLLLVASEEHLRALNWVCGLTEWPEIHLPD